MERLSQSISNLIGIKNLIQSPRRICAFFTSKEVIYCIFFDWEPDIQIMLFDMGSFLSIKHTQPDIVSMWCAC
jgi:hypothetical protein